MTAGLLSCGVTAREGCGLWLWVGLYAACDCLDDQVEAGFELPVVVAGLDFFGDESEVLRGSVGWS